MGRIKALTDLLNRCTVRLDVTDTDGGTGFFVAPGLILTSGHVVTIENAINPELVEFVIEALTSTEKQVLVFSSTINEHPDNGGMKWHETIIRKEVQLKGWRFWERFC